MKQLLYLLLPLLVLIIGCKKKEAQLTATSENTTKYLNSFTRGMIQADETIRFQFKSDLEIQEENIASAVTTKPKFDRNVSFNKNLNTLEITPKKPLEYGQTYEVSVRLDKLVKGLKKQTVVSELKVHSQYVTVKRKGLLIDDEDNKFLEIDVSTSIPTTSDKIINIFDVSKDRISINKIDKNNFIVQIKQVGKSKPIQWNAKSLQGDESGILEFYKNVDGFSVVSLDYNSESNIVTAYFSERIDKNQDLSGLVSIGNDDAKHSIEDNKLIIYVQDQLQKEEFVNLRKGIRSITGKLLDKDVQYKIDLAITQPKVEWLSDGVYIPKDGNFKIPFRARGLKAVQVSVAAFKDERAAQFAAWNHISNLEKYELIRYGDFIYEEEIRLEKKGLDLLEWNEFGLDLSDAFKRNPGYIYRVYINFVPSQTVLACKSAELKDVEIEMLKKEWFNNKHNYRSYNYDYSDIENPCTPSYYVYNDAISKNIHCTNVFPIFKQGENSLTVAAKSLLKSSLAKGAQIELLNLQGKSIDTQRIGGSGIATFANLPMEPKAVRITHSNITSYFSLKDGFENSITEFDVSSGVNSIENKIFVYSERDVRRPGDNIYLNVMLNQADFDYPAGLPVKINLYNPKQVLVATKQQSITDNQAIYSFSFPTNVADPTGNWQAQIQVGPTTLRKNVRIETIKPNQVDAVFSFRNQEKEKVFANKLTGSAQVDFLAGFPLKGGKIKMSGNVYPITNPFIEDFSGYRFTDYKTEASKDVKLAEVTTNQSGKASFDIDYNFYDKNAVSNLVVDSEIQLPGGGLNTQTNYFKVYPYESYIGLKQPKGSGWRGSFRYGEVPKIKVVNVNRKGRKLSRSSQATATLYIAKDDWWYDRYRLSNNVDVKSSSYFKEIKSFPIQFNNGQATYTHNGAESGLYVLRVKDNKSGHISEIRFHAVSDENYNVENNPVFFEINTEKDIYQVGDNLLVKLPKMKDSKAFVTLEKGDQVLKSFWMDLNTPNLEIPIEANYYPNFYLNVSIVQNYGQKNNDRPLRMYSIKKIKINERESIIEPQISMPEKVRPNETFTVKVSEENGQPMEYTLAVVDRGLLNLTGFQTPNPIQHFSRQFSLFVKTWDIYDDLIYYMNPAFAGIFSIGGDGMNKKLDEAADFNRFEPVVYHYGPFKLKKGKSNQHEIDLPNYIGNLRVMVVATNKETFGSQEKNVKVASSLMIQSQLPRALNVTDKVVVPVTIFRDESTFNTANISASNDNNALKFLKASEQIRFTDGNQSLANLEFQVGDKAGKTTIDLNAKGGKFKTNETTDIYVNYPNSYESRVEYIEIPGNESRTIDISSFGFDETKNVDVSIAGIMLPSFTEMHESLLEYPYGCLEQTTSKGFSLLYLPEIVELDAQQKKQAQDGVSSVFDKFTRFQNADGSFKYWENGYYHEWANLYAGHFLLDAKEVGQSVNSSMLKNWLDFTTKQANKWNVSGTSLRTQNNEEMIQAYRLYLLAKANQPSKSAMNRLQNSGSASPMANILLAGAYAYTGMNDVATDLLNTGLANYNETDYSYATFGSPIRNKSIILEVLLLTKQPKEQVNRYYNELVREINNESWLNTQEKGFAMIASHAYLDGKKSSGERSFTVDSKAHQKNMKLSNNSFKNFHWSADQLNDQLTIHNKDSEPLYVVKTERAISKDLYQAPKQQNLSLEVNYTDLNGSSIQPKSIKQGQDVIINVNVRNTDITNHNSLALSVKMPSGWELINPRMMETAQLKNDSFNYQDYRDDRVYTFFSLDTNELKRFKFKAKANLKGDFYLPSITAEHMYQGNVQANTKADRAVVN